MAQTVGTFILNTDGHEDKVLEIKWGEASIYFPPGDWFHQHFNLRSNRQWSAGFLTRETRTGMSAFLKR
jgi:hypothetical protein